MSNLSRNFGVRTNEWWIVLPLLQPLYIKTRAVPCQQTVDLLGCTDLSVPSAVVSRTDAVSVSHVLQDTACFELLMRDDYTLRSRCTDADWNLISRQSRFNWTKSLWSDFDAEEFQLQLRFHRCFSGPWIFFTEISRKIVLVIEWATGIKTIQIDILNCCGRC
jgi:hypothetical protein